MGCEPVEQIQILPSGNLIVCYGNMTHIPTILNLVTLDSYVELPRDTYLYLMDLSTTYYSVKQFGQLVSRGRDPSQTWFPKMVQKFCFVRVYIYIYIWMIWRYLEEPPICNFQKWLDEMQIICTYHGLWATFWNSAFFHHSTVMARNTS